MPLVGPVVGATGTGCGRAIRVRQFPFGFLSGRSNAGQTTQRVEVQILSRPLVLQDVVVQGEQHSGRDDLRMTLFQAHLPDQNPKLPPKSTGSQLSALYVNWRWCEPRRLEDPARIGSLCSQFLLGHR